MEDRPLRVLFVCLGNICRSPTAEGVFRYLIDNEAPRLRVEIDSAGTADFHAGEAPDPRTQRAALRRGIDLSGLQARQVRADDFNQFDYVLAMDRDNLRDLRELQPAASRADVRLFLEFAPALDRLEMPDPYFGDDSGFEDVVDLSIAASRGLIAWLEQRT